MRRLEAFSGIRVLTYSLMSNHFHLLCEVPQAQELSEAELIERIQAGYGPARRQALDQQLALLRQAPDGADQIQRFLQPLTSRASSKSSKVALPKWARGGWRREPFRSKPGRLFCRAYQCRKITLSGGEARVARLSGIKGAPFLPLG